MAEMLSVTEREFGTIRVFSVDIEPAEMRRLLDPKPDMMPTGAALGGLLGLDWIDPDHADLFDVADLDDLGLLGFLEQGAGISEDELTAHRAQLEALEGVVLIVYAKGFMGKAVELKPQPRVTPIVCLKEVKSAIEFQPLQSKSAEGDIAPASVPQSNPHLTLIIAILALPILLLIVGAVLWGVLR